MCIYNYTVWHEAWHEVNVFIERTAKLNSTKNVHVYTGAQSAQLRSVYQIIIRQSWKKK